MPLLSQLELISENESPESVIAQDPLMRPLPPDATADDMQCATSSQLESCVQANGPSAGAARLELEFRATGGEDEGPNGSDGYSSRPLRLPSSTTKVARQLVCLRLLLCNVQQVSGELPAKFPTVTLRSFGIVSACFSPFIGRAFLDRVRIVSIVSD